MANPAPPGQSLSVWTVSSVKSPGDRRSTKCAPLGAGHARAVQPAERHGVVLVVATKGRQSSIVTSLHRPKHAKIAKAT
jgi:hypothetical protein